MAAWHICPAQIYADSATISALASSAGAIPLARNVPINNTKLLSKITANASDGKKSNAAPRASSTSIPNTAVINPRGKNQTMISRSRRLNPFQIGRPASTAIHRAISNAPKHASANKIFFRSPRKLHQRSKQHKEKCPQQKCQLSVKREHLFVLLFDTSPFVGDQRALRKPSRRIRRVIDVQSSPHHRKVRQRQAEHEHRNQLIPFQRMGS